MLWLDKPNEEHIDDPIIPIQGVLFKKIDYNSPKPNKINIFKNKEKRLGLY